MKIKSVSLLLIYSCAYALPLSAATLFSNNFEDDNLNPEVGTWTFNNPSTTSVVDTAVASDPTLGNKVGLLDLVTPGGLALNLDLNMTSTASLTGGQTVKLDFDFSARRTNGFAKTIYVDALDSSGNQVIRLVLGDANAFGNGGGDRQRPGYETAAGGRVVLPGPSTPGSFWWGADATPATFDVVRDAHFSLTIGENGFDITTTRASGTSYSTTGLGTYDGLSHSDISSFKISSEAAGYGFYVDNLVVESVPVPEPSSTLLGGVAALGLLLRRRR